MPPKINIDEVTWDESPQIDVSQVQWDELPQADPPDTGLSGKLSKRAENVSEIFTKPEDSIYGAMRNAPRRVLRAAGEVGGFITDAAIEAAKAGYEAFVPESLQNTMEENFKRNIQVFETPIRAASKAYGKAEEMFPEGMKDVEAVANIAGAIPVLQGTSAAIKTGGKAAVAAAKPLGTVVKEVVGAYTGRGPGFIEEMVKGSKAAEKAMRGEITGEEIVDHAKTALQKVRDMRGENYLRDLDTVRANPEKLTAIRTGAKKKINELADADHFDVGITITEEGKPIVDFSKSTIIEHQKVVERAINDVLSWEDDSARGLDTLTKRLSKYEDQAGRGTPAESFVTQLRNDVSGGLKKTVPKYEEMTKGYREASTLIKDIESNLMLRKEGMTGRITADQTLRRLSSALQEGKEMRKDLLRALGTESGMDIPAEVAGYLAQQWVPAGILGKGLTMGSAWALHFVNPQWWPVLAASSPRIVGEFLNTYGKAVKATKGGIKKMFTEKASDISGVRPTPLPLPMPERGFTLQGEPYGEVLRPTKPTPGYFVDAEYGGYGRKMLNAPEPIDETIVFDPIKEKEFGIGKREVRLLPWREGYYGEGYELPKGVWPQVSNVKLREAYRILNDMTAQEQLQWLIENTR